MAVVNGSNVSVFGHTAPHGIRKDSSGNLYYGCYVSANFTGTYAQADNAQIQNVHTAIAGSLRSNRTITLIDAAFAAPGNEAGAFLGAKTVAISTNDITFELTSGETTTEHANAAVGAMTEPLVLFVSYRFASL